MRTERRPGRHAGAPGPRPGRLSGFWVLLLIGVVGVLLGLAGLSSVQGLRDHGVRTSAEVLDIASVKGGYSYILRYGLENGTVVNCETEDVLGRPARGAALQVLYDRELPDVNCQSADYGTDLTAPVVMIIAGVVMMVSAAGIRIFSR